MKAEYILRIIFVGIIVTFFLFSVFFIGIYSSYIKYYGINLFYNPFFAQSLNLYVFIGLSLFFGIGFVLPYVGKIIKILYALMLIASMLMLIPFLGKSVGHMLLAKKDKVILEGKEIFVEVLYNDGFYKVYMNPSTKDLDTLEKRKENLIYYEIPQKNKN